jgi:hypothetical protein
MAGQAISALLQVSRPASPQAFGFSAAQAQADGLTIVSSVTSIFWVYVVFVIAMAFSCAWLATASNAAPFNPVPASPGGHYPAGGYQAAPNPIGAGTAASSEPGDDAVPGGGEPASDDAEPGVADQGREVADQEQRAGGEEDRAGAEGHADGEGRADAEERADGEEHRADNEVSTL